MLQDSQPKPQWVIWGLGPQGRIGGEGKEHPKQSRVLLPCHSPSALLHSQHCLLGVLQTGVQHFAPALAKIQDKFRVLA